MSKVSSRRADGAPVVKRSPPPMDANKSSRVTSGQWAPNISPFNTTQQKYSKLCRFCVIIMHSFGRFGFRNYKTKSGTEIAIIPTAFGRSFAAFGNDKIFLSALFTLEQRD